MVISVASDHAGYEYKNEVINYLLSKGYQVIDCGTNSKESCDYPIYGKEAARMIKIGKAEFGVLICSSGEGIMMAANKIPGIRCGIGYNDEVAKLLREHNNANMISFGANFMKLEDIYKRIDIFLSTPFAGGRHERRVNEIE